MKRLIPKFIVQIYHWLLAKLSAVVYGWPSEKLIVIGVTGTSGKSSTCEILSQLLEQAGFRVGLASTIKFKIASQEKLNDMKMTMVGRFMLQKMLRDMVRAKCDYAIVETTSEGIRQFRHLGIHYDILVFTNLYPEHIDSHGSFENYKNAKLKLFKHLEKLPHKQLTVNSYKLTIEKVIIANVDDEHAKDFLNFKVDKKIGFGISDLRFKISDLEIIKAENIKLSSKSITFSIQHSEFSIRLLGEHNVYNALAAIAVGLSQGISLEKLKLGLSKVTGIAGRLEFISEGQNFQIIVDYAFEPRAMAKLYEVVAKLEKRKIIHVLGTTGGGRDKDRGFRLGEYVGKKADIVIATNEDPYEDDPAELIDRVARGASVAGKIINKDLFKVLDRKVAIKQALQQAKEQDLVLITGKGSEQAIILKDGKHKWDDRQVVRELLAK